MIDEFYNKILEFKNKYFKDKDLIVLEKYGFYIKLRIVIADNFFISIRYNKRTDRQDFALIKGKKRIIGFDNLGGWHKHSFENPDDHLECDEPSIEEVLKEFIEIIKKI